jgi:hypothetical protein
MHENEQVKEQEDFENDEDDFQGLHTLQYSACGNVPPI